ncbi:MAG: hypothetical protein LBK58_08125 [Prevotellaceae bacterium]|jgi:hypothetical protein|nr:hypothetical protein [Prevotellaceae bacterium]
MRKEDFKNKLAVDQYGETVVVWRVNWGVAYTNKGTYHSSKLFVGGRSIQTLLNKQL